MKKIIPTLLFLLVAYGVFSQNRQTMKDNRYANEWAKVMELEQQSLPQSASAEVDKILRRAMADENGPQIIKALIHQGKYELAVDAQNDTIIFRKLKQMAGESDDVVERSILHSMLGELYLQYYRKDQWNIRQRTELGDFVPADMKEWTRNIFYDKVVEHLNASLATQDELEKVMVERYAAIVTLGRDSRVYYPTMYDFLARRAIDIFSQIDADEDLSRLLARKNMTQQSLFSSADAFVKRPFDPQPNEYALWAPETFRKLLASLQKRKMDQSVVLTELDKLGYLSRLTQVYATHALPSLEQLLEQWKGRDFSVEIIDRMADFYQNQIYSGSEQDSTVKERKSKELYDLLQSAIRRYSAYERVAVLENRLLQLIQPEFSVTGNKTFPVKGEKKLHITFKNLRSFSAKLYRIESPKDVLTATFGVRKNTDSNRKFLREMDVSLPEKAPYLQGDTSFTLAVDEPGTYMLTFHSSPRSPDNDQGEYYFAVTDLTVFTRSTNKNEYDFFVVDRTTGEPAKEAQVVIYKLPGNWRNSSLTQVVTLPVNEMGLAVYQKDIPNNDVYYHAVAGDDRGSLLSRLPYGFYASSDKEPETQETVTLFTDRSLYRPGQTVYYKAVLLKTAGSTSSVVSNKELAFVLRDVNGQEISSQQRKTNAFGSVSGEFVLPQGLLPGDFNIETESGSVNLRVEEYKRPTFEVTFDSIEQTYRVGEEITLKGKAVTFSGIQLQDAAVSYRITRQQTWWWRWGGPPEPFTQGEVVTDDHGQFTIRFIPVKGDDQHNLRSVYTFAVEATITDLNGETQLGTYTVTVGDISMLLQLVMPERWDKESTEEIVITAKNLDGSDITAEGTYQVYSLQENDSLRQRVAEGSFESGKQSALRKELSVLPSGKYRVKLLSEDDRGNTVEAEKDIILFSYADQRPPIQTNEWIIEKNTTLAPGKKAEVLFGVTDRVPVLYELWQENKLLAREWMTLENENKRFSFPYQPAYAKGITLMLSYVRNERFYSHRVELQPASDSKELKVKLDVFRDRIRPGAAEEWRITVTDEAGKPALSEVLASMYDFSLDRIYPSQPWHLRPIIHRPYFTRMGFSGDHSFGKEYGRGYIPVPMKEVPSFLFDQFNWYGFSFYPTDLMVRGVRSQAMEEVMVGYGTVKGHIRGVAADRKFEADEMVLADRELNAGAAPPPPSPAASEAAAPQIRRNLNETAFFFPQLKTNEKGEVQIAFTVPESNTRWRFRVLAHDKKLQTGQAEAFTVSQKELMVTPNMPRFLRHGDQTTIVTKISNLSDGPVTGKVRLEFFNPVTGERIDTLSPPHQEQAFTLEKDASADASWLFVVPDDIDLLGLRIVAQSARFSDGEQHALVVLPNRMLVTESMRLDLNGPQTKEFSMDRLLKRTSATLQDYRLTLEFTSNPAWYAVQALPVLSEPESDNAISWFASFYGNAMGAHIGKAYPRVASMVEAWKKQGGSRETFLSDLEKNQELKSVLLEETPWVLEAATESEQKEKLSLLFDLNRSQSRISAALQKLQELQTTEGGWSWFKGFRSDVGITHYILYGFQQLKTLNAVDFSGDVLSMQTSALSYIDAEAVRRFETWKKYNKDWKNSKTIPLTDLEYLYVRSGYDKVLQGESDREMTRFYLSVIEKNWTAFGLYERSLIAILMKREGKTQVVQDILASFREHATVSEETGMYWANNRAQVFMSQSALSVHTFIMEAFLAGDALAAETDEMKRWLLKQKQTQRWESTHATMDAVYALLSSGSDWFATEGRSTVKLGSVTIEPDSREEGTGFFRESWTRNGITPDMGRVVVSHQGNAPAWGALYWQYFEDMDKITKTDASLDIEKQLFVEQPGESGTELVRITRDKPLKVGDKVIVRLTVRNDRDLEFVHLKDMRAAAFEPVDQVSGLRWQNGAPYYQTSKDASTNFYFDQLPRGTRVFEYAVFVNRAGSYANGITTIQCMYAPEFTSHTAGMRIIVKE